MVKNIRTWPGKALSFLRRDENFPIVLLMLSLFSFGILIPWLGLYSDDWHYFWLSYRLDFIARFFTRNRPYLGLVYDVINDFIGASPLQWQVVLFLLKWTGVTTLWMTLKKIFPASTDKAKWICLLFAFYPGNLILFQPLVFIVAVLQLNLFFLSFFLTILAIQRPQRKLLFLIPALAASSMNLVASEYFFFLELLRPVVIWAVLAQSEQSKKSRKKKAILEWLPFLAVFAAVAVWRFLFQNTLSSHQVWLLQDFVQQPGQTLIAFLTTIANSTGQLFLTAWNNPVLQDQIYEPQQMGITFYYLVLTFFSALFLFRFFFNAKKINDDNHTQSAENWWLGLTGLAAIFLGGLPIWLSKYNLDFAFRTENRFVLPFFLGVSLSLAGFTYALFRDRLTRTICLTAAVVAGVGFQFLTSNLYLQETDNLRQYYWQLQWRAPSLQTGVHLVSNPPPFSMMGENSLSAGINWVYGRNEAAKQIDYYLYFNPQRIQKEIGTLEKDKPIQIGHQIGDFSGKRLLLLAFDYSPPGCLHMVDPAIPETAKDAPDYVLDAALNSDLQLISAQSSDLNINRLHQIFGSEPEHGWCYYFEKADLARQQKDWVGIKNLFNQVTEQQLKPSNLLEWSPFIEGLARSQEWQPALSISQQITSTTPDLNNSVCHLWRRILSAVTPSDAQILAEIRNTLNPINCALN